MGPCRLTLGVVIPLDSEINQFKIDLNFENLELVDQGDLKF